MHRERRLHVGEGRDDDAPDALDGVERQDAAMALDQPAHHVGLARRAERGADFLGLLHLDQPVDDVAARHQQAVDLLVDACRSLCAAPRARAERGVAWTSSRTSTPDRRIAGKRVHSRLGETAAEVRRKRASRTQCAAGGLVNHGLALTKSPPGTSFSLFRGHLSRPACSHVKQLAKQAGDRSDPGRTYCSGRVFYGLISVHGPPRGGRCRDGKRAVDTKPVDP